LFLEGHHQFRCGITNNIPNNRTMGLERQRRSTAVIIAANAANANSHDMHHRHDQIAWSHGRVDETGGGPEIVSEAALPLKRRINASSTLLLCAD
jgi:hypothetical protein